MASVGVLEKKSISVLIRSRPRIPVDHLSYLAKFSLVVVHCVCLCVPSSYLVTVCMLVYAYRTLRRNARGASDAHICAV